MVVQKHPRRLLPPSTFERAIVSLGRVSPVLAIEMYKPLTLSAELWNNERCVRSCGAKNAGFMILRWRWCVSPKRLFQTVDGSVITEDYEPCTQTIPPSNNNSIIFNTSVGLGKWYPDVWRIYCRAFGSAITKRSLYGFLRNAW